MRTWIVGIDLHHRSDGAARFAVWLAGHSAAAPTFVGVHAAPDAALADLELFEGRGRVLERLRTEAELALTHAGTREAFAAVEVVEAEHAGDGLARARADRAAEGLIVGRKASREGADLVRLGGVARRLLQRLVAPTIVVPPDLDPAQLGAGPVVIAVTPAEASLGAVRFGVALAASISRPVVFVRAISIPDEYAQIFWSGDAMSEFKERRVKTAETQTAAWLKAQGQEGPLRVRFGDEVEEILATAAELGAPLLVCGSRLLNRLERLVAMSVSSELAARAPVPVLVVPPDA